MFTFFMCYSGKRHNSLAEQNYTSFIVAFAILLESTFMVMVWPKQDKFLLRKIFLALNWQYHRTYFSNYLIEFIGFYIDKSANNGKISSCTVILPKIKASIYTSSRVKYCQRKQIFPQRQAYVLSILGLYSLQLCQFLLQR